MTNSNQSEQALDRLVRQALNREASTLGTTDLARRIALDAAAGRQAAARSQRPMGRQQFAPWFSKPAWLIWPSAAALAASAMIGFFAGTGALPVSEYVSFQDPLTEIDRQLAGVTGGFTTGFDLGTAEDRS
ncbi:MAG: hypothetical protein AAF556_09805 [Pseudomonadota bacterium]